MLFRSQALPAEQVPAFWERLDALASAAVELQVRNGQLHWQPSRHSGTRAPA